MADSTLFADVFGRHRGSPEREAQWRRLEQQLVELERDHAARRPALTALAATLEAALPLAIIAHAHAREDLPVEIQAGPTAVQFQCWHPDHGLSLSLELPGDRGVRAFSALERLAGLPTTAPCSRAGWRDTEGVWWMATPRGRVLRAALRQTGPKAASLSLNTAARRVCDLFSDQQVRDAEALPLDFRLLGRGV